MGSIPLPALDVKTPEQPDLLAKYSQLQALRGAQQEQQQRAALAPLQQQQAQQSVQQGGLQIQQQQRALQDQQARTAAMTEWDGKSINDLYPLILKHGGSADAVMSLKSQVLEQQQKAATAFKDQADGGKALVDAAKEKGDLISGALTPLTDPAQVPDDQLPQVLQSTVQDLAKKELLDPQHAQAAEQLVQQAGGNPAKIRQGIALFNKTNMAQSQILTDAHVEAQTAESKANAANARGKIDPTSPLYAPTADSVALGTAPGAAQIQAGEADLAGKKAAAEAQARLPFEMRLKSLEQSLTQGDPNDAAKLLVSGDGTLSELKSRGATPSFIARTLHAANILSGGKYNAPAADAALKVAQSPENLRFFGSAGSLTDKGGTLDQLAAAAKDIPDGQIPVFNSLADAVKAAAGSGPLAKYAAIMVGASDDYSKVMGGGTGSDSSRAQALNLIPANASPEARAAAIQGIRGAVNSQKVSRIGNNPVLGRMYGTPGGVAPSGGISVGSVITQNGHQYKVTAVSKDGKPASAEPVQ